MLERNVSGHFSNDMHILMCFWIAITARKIGVDDVNMEELIGNTDGFADSGSV